MDGTIAPLAGICELAERHRRDRGRRRLACDRVHGRRRARHARALRRHGPRRRPDRHARQGARRRERRLRVRAARRSSPGCASARGPTSSRTRSRRSSRRRRSRSSTCSSRRPAPRRQLAENAAWFRARLAADGLPPGARRAPDHPGHDRRRRARRAHGGPPARARRVRDRLLLPGRADGQGAHPHADVRGHTRAMLETAAAAFAQAGRELGIIGK